MRKKSKVVQFNNDFVNQSNKRKRLELKDDQKKNRLLGAVLVLVIFLFILPTYNLVASYQNLESKREELSELKKEYKNLEQEVSEEQLLANRLSDETYAAKYVRAKYYYSLNSELIFTIPSLIPQ